jgi:hypothetical protein
MAAMIDDRPIPKVGEARGGAEVAFTLWARPKS